MHITLQQDQRPDHTLIENGHPRSAKLLAFANQAEMCLIYFVIKIDPLEEVSEIQ